MYTIEQLTPKEYPRYKPSFEHINLWCLLDSGKWYPLLYSKSLNCFPAVDGCVVCFIDIPGAPDEVKPLAYPENKPGDGYYIAHLEDGDIWTVLEYKERWRYIMCTGWGDAGIDYFIPIRLDEPVSDTDKLGYEGKMDKVIWDTDIMEVTQNKNGLVFTPIDRAEIEPDEITAFCLYWLEDFAKGYTVIRKEPEVKPCPFCGNHMKYTDFDWTFHKNDYGSDYFISCFGCAMRGPSYPTPDEAIKAWNDLPRKEDTNL
jgi:hypothetical protein